MRHIPTFLLRKRANRVYASDGESKMNFVLFPKLSALRASNCGIAILNPGWVHPSRRLGTSVLILGKKSRAEISEEGERFAVEPGKFVILAAERSHEGVRPIDEPASYFWMHFSTAEPPLVLGEGEALAILRDHGAVQRTLSDSLLLPREATPADPKVFLDLFHDLLFEQEHPSFTPQKMQYLFKLMLISLNETVLAGFIEGKYDTTRFSLIYAAIQSIHENFTDGNFSVKSLSDIMGYNPDYLGRIFKTRMGKSLGDYIIDQRIKYASCLLEESNNTIDSISYDSGFNSPRNFVRQFKARKGETPSELRQRHRTMHVTNR